MYKIRLLRILFNCVLDNIIFSKYYNNLKVKMDKTIFFFINKFEVKPYLLYIILCEFSNL